MAKPLEVTVGVTYKKNLPNYENITFHAGVKMSLEEGETQKKVFEKAWDDVGAQIEQQLSLFQEEEKSGMKKGL